MTVLAPSSHGIRQVHANLAASGFAESDFDAIVAGDKLKANKPAPDIFLAGAQLMGLKPTECVVVEDTPSGVQAAKTAGPGGVKYTAVLRALFIAWRHRCWWV